MSGILLLLMTAAVLLGVTATPSALHSGATTNSFTTATVTAIAAGGIPAYTYAWTLLIPPTGGANFTINSPAAAATSVNITGITNGALNTGTIRCTVTDSVAATAIVDVSIRHLDQRPV